MTELNYKYITDFHKSRKNRIGASDVPHLVPHPIKQIESLAAWTDKDGKRNHCTALDLYNEKINGKDFEYSFPAVMGHRLEPYALYEFIADNINHDKAGEFLHGYQQHAIDQFKTGKAQNPEPYNNTPFKHNTEAQNDYGVAHCDCIYDPRGVILGNIKDIPMKKNKNGHWIININGIKINLSKPFLIEAKSAQLYSVSARKKDQYKGYDLTLKEWQGIPLKVYFQIQYQLALYNVDVCYLSLIFNTSEKYYWTIKANKKHQRDLIQVAQYMKQCIDSKTPPTELVMNSKDIQSLYPEIKDDFREIKDDELIEVLGIARLQREAIQQEKIWEQKKKDASERMAIHLKYTKTIKGMVNGSLQTIANWKKTGGGVYIQGMKDIKEREDSKRLLKYLEKNDLIKEKNSGRTPSVVIKAEELEAGDERI